jgi:siroheme synthase
MAALIAAGIPFEVVPGVSSIHAGPAAAGIPLTHRDHTHGFLVVAVSRSMRFEDAEWRAAHLLLQSGGTVVVLMGLARINEIVHNLIQKGCAPETPAAVISKATRPDQDIRYGVARDIAHEAIGATTPALLVLGNVVGLSPDFIKKIANHANARK